MQPAVHQPDLHPSAHSTASSTGAPLNSSTSSDANSRLSRQARQGRACDTCRRRKVRCDGGGPASEPGQADQPCVLCVQQGISCTFEQRTTKRGPPKGYVESLERRLEAMEALLTQLAPKEGGANPSAATSSTPLSRDDALSDGHDEGSIDSMPPTSSIPPTGLDAIDKLRLKLSDMSIEHDRFVGRGSGIHLVRSMQQYAQPLDPSFIDDVRPSAVEGLLLDEHNKLMVTTPLPPPELGNKLVDAAFNGYSLRELIPRAYFDDCMKRGMVETEPTFRSLYFALLALGSRSVPNTDDPIFDPDERRMSQGWHWFRASIFACGSPFATADIFVILRGVVLTMWQLGAAGFISCWMMCGFAVRQAIDVGVHYEKRANWKSSPLRDQLRKRSFAVLVSLDQYISTCLGRPFAIQEEDWDVQPPLGISDEALLAWDAAARDARAQGLPIPPPAQEEADTAQTGPAPSISGSSTPRRKAYQATYPWSATMQLHSIMAQVTRTLYGLKSDRSLKGTRDAVRDLDSRLNAWLDKVPPALRWNPSQLDDASLVLSAAIYIRYYHCQIFVHREFVSPSRSIALGFPSLAICSNAARSTAHVLDTLRQRNLLQSAFGFAPVAAVHSAFVLLLGRFASPDSKASLTPSAAADVKRCINALHDLAPTTFIANKCYTGIIKLAALIATPPPARHPLSESGPSSLKRSNPDDWNDGCSPAASMGDRPSPNSSGDGSDAGGIDLAGHKQRKLSRLSEGKDRTGLPVSTSDLSCETFKGRATFSADGSLATQPTGPGPNANLSGTGTNPASSTTALGTGSERLFNPSSTGATSGSAIDPFAALGSQSMYASSTAFDPNVPSVPPTFAPLGNSTIPVELSTSAAPHTSASFDGFPSTEVPAAGGPSDPFIDFRSDFFSFTPSATAQLPPEVGQAAADIWNELGQAADVGPSAARARSDAPSTTFGRGGPSSLSSGFDAFAAPGGFPSMGYGVTPGASAAAADHGAAFDPFANWDLMGGAGGLVASPPPIDDASRNPLDPMGWNVYDPALFSNL
ncbi:hypothetical protein JCM10212_006780 [Sporobolomyces blumeae]